MIKYPLYLAYLALSDCKLIQKLKDYLRRHLPSNNNVQ